MTMQIKSICWSFTPATSAFFQFWQSKRCILRHVEQKVQCARANIDDKTTPNRVLRPSRHLPDVHVRVSSRWFEPNVLASARRRTFASACDTDLQCITHLKVPFERTIRRNLAVALALRTWASNNSTAFAQECVLVCHHSSPQQIVQRPALWFGLHLLPCSP